MKAPIVLDTNIVLDLFVYDDPATVTVDEALTSGALDWVATGAMRDELERVLDYPHIAARMAPQGLVAPAVLARFDALSRRVETPPKAPFTCKDADDQKFIDLAVAQRATLLSKDKAVLALRRRLATLGVPVGRTWVGSPPPQA